MPRACRRARTSRSSARHRHSSRRTLPASCRTSICRWRPRARRFSKTSGACFATSHSAVAHVRADHRAPRAHARTCTRGGHRRGPQRPISIAIPCHRVVGADGALTGYAGGLPRKAALLRPRRASHAGRRTPAPWLTTTAKARWHCSLHKSRIARTMRAHRPTTITSPFHAPLRCA
ncbi:MGMT family protein [Cupriavidus basilensis]